LNVGIGILILIAGGALIGLIWTPWDPLEMDFSAKLAGPSLRHFLGTDEFGRDVLSRLLVGADESLLIGSLTVIISITVGSFIGAITGYWRGAFDRIVMTLNDALLAFPGILLALGLLVVLGANEYGIVLALSLSYIPSVVRVVRAAAISVSGLQYVEASVLMGNGRLYTLCRHVLPNCVAPIIVLGTSMFGWAILAESALSFLGLGLAPPLPSWGNMLAASQAYIGQAVWLSIFPGLLISLTLLGINLVGDGLRDQFDPRTRDTQ
jgi:peptide/nickel transport system permease protein